MGGVGKGFGARRFRWGTGRRFGREPRGEVQVGIRGGLRGGLSGRATATATSCMRAHPETGCSARLAVAVLVLFGN